MHIQCLKLSILHPRRMLCKWFSCNISITVAVQQCVCSTKWLCPTDHIVAVQLLWVYVLSRFLLQMQSWVSFNSGKQRRKGALKTIELLSKWGLIGTLKMFTLLSVFLLMLCCEQFPPDCQILNPLTSFSILIVFRCLVAFAGLWGHYTPHEF